MLHRLPCSAGTGSWMKTAVSIPYVLDEVNLAKCAPRMSECDLTFTPPVYMQRYQEMKNMVKKYQPKQKSSIDFVGYRKHGFCVKYCKSVLDMGCGECRLLRQLKQEEGIHQLTGVDVDRDVLQANRYLAQPLMWEYLHPRPHPFTVSLYEGSIGEKDYRMVGYDLVLCVEIIEHLYPDTLAALPGVVFGYMQPKIVVITTPNADFNVLFPNFQGFRHWDHKFEWSREEFQTWSNQAASDYGYTVTYEGIGAGPPDTEHLGCCTQMAVFTCILPPHEGSRHDDCNSATPYNLVCEVKYPHRETTMTIEEQILSEATFYLRRLSHGTWRCYTEDEESSDVTGSHDQETETDLEDEEKRRTISISLETMMKFSCLRKVCPSIEKLRDVLTSCESISMSEDRTSVIYSSDERISDSEDSLETSDDESRNGETADIDDGNFDSNENDSSSWQPQEENWDW